MFQSKEKKKFKKTKIALVISLLLLLSSITSFLLYTSDNVGIREPLPEGGIYFTDIDGDLDEDIITMNGILLENDHGSFRKVADTGRTISRGYYPFLHLNNDTLLDCFSIDDEGTISIYLQEIDHSFNETKHENIQVGAYDQYLFIDINRDEIIDLTISNLTATRIYMNTGTGDLSFLTSINYSYPVCSTDLNDDGIDEILFSNYTHLTLVTLINNTFKYQSFPSNEYTISTNPAAHREYQIIDVDGDGDEDLIGRSYNTIIMTQGMNWGADFILENDYPNGFRFIDLIGYINESRYYIEYEEVRYLRDIDNDMDLDIIAIKEFSVESQDNMKIYIRKNDGNNTFIEEEIYTILPRCALYFIDLNDDNYLEIVCGCASDEKIIIMENQKDGAFKRNDIKIDGIRLFSKLDPAHLMFVDVNDDDDTDILGRCYNGRSVVVFHNQGNFDFSNQDRYRLSEGWLISDTYITDIDLDGDEDIISVEYVGFYGNEEYNLIILKNKGDGNYKSTGYYLRQLNVAAILFFIYLIIILICIPWIYTIKNRMISRTLKNISKTTSSFNEDNIIEITEGIIKRKKNDALFVFIQLLFISGFLVFSIPIIEHGFNITGAFALLIDLIFLIAIIVFFIQDRNQIIKHSKRLIEIHRRKEGMTSSEMEER